MRVPKPQAQSSLTLLFASIGHCGSRCCVPTMWPGVTCVPTTWPDVTCSPPRGQE